MKTVKMLAATALLASLFTACLADDRFVSVDKLPAAVKAFATTHYPEARILSAHSEGFMGGYGIALSDGTQAELSRRGELREIEAPRGEVLPATVEALLPVPAREYLKANWPAARPRSIQKDDGRWSVELAGERNEVVFDKRGGYLGLDD